MDTLYMLCRSVDRQHAPPFTEAQAAEIVERKKAYFQHEAAQNPLLREILEGGTVTYFGIKEDDRRGILEGPATFFRTHEILRHSRRNNSPVMVGGREHPHDEVAGLFARCMPNAKLQHVPWFSPSRYSTSLGLAWMGALLAACLVAHGGGDTAVFDGQVLFYLGLWGTIAALIYSALKSNRDVRLSSPWNTALYLDLNADLVCRNSPLLAMARREFIPEQKPFKQPSFYYPLARRIEAHGFDEELGKRMAAGLKTEG